ncbi:MAG: hypothetical protein ACI8QY_000826 [bacterium]|jgi:hypothetical protein
MYPQPTFVQKLQRKFFPTDFTKIPTITGEISGLDVKVERIDSSITEYPTGHGLKSTFHTRADLEREFFFKISISEKGSEKSFDLFFAYTEYNMFGYDGGTCKISSKSSMFENIFLSDTANENAQAEGLYLSASLENHELCVMWKFGSMRTTTTYKGPNKSVPTTNFIPAS